MNDMPDWLLAPIVLALLALAVLFLAFAERILVVLAPAIARHRISGWLFFKDATRVRAAGLMYLAAAIALLYLRFVER